MAEEGSARHTTARGVRAEFAQPEPQTTRGRVRCECGQPCFYCGRVERVHDHDHFPVAWRHGGRETVAACRRCHKIKESARIDNWPDASQRAVVEGMPAEALFAVSWIVATVDNDTRANDLAMDRDFALRLVHSCTTPEARIGIAIALNLAADTHALWQQEAASC